MLYKVTPVFTCACFTIVNVLMHKFGTNLYIENLLLISKYPVVKGFLSVCSCFRQQKSPFTNRGRACKSFLVNAPVGVNKK